MCNEFCATMASISSKAVCRRLFFFSNSGLPLLPFLSPLFLLAIKDDGELIKIQSDPLRAKGAFLFLNDCYNITYKRGRKFERETWLRSWMKEGRPSFDTSYLPRNLHSASSKVHEILNLTVNWCLRNNNRRVSLFLSLLDYFKTCTIHTFVSWEC